MENTAKDSSAKAEESEEPSSPIDKDDDKQSSSDAKGKKMSFPFCFVKMSILSREADVTSFFSIMLKPRTHGIVANTSQENSIEK